MMVVCAGVLALRTSSLVGAQEPERSRLIAPYFTGMLGFATGPGECVDGPCFPSAPMIFAASGGARVRLASLGARGGAWASLGVEHTRLPLFPPSNPTPTAWLAAGRLTVGARTRVAVSGSTGTVRYSLSRGRMVQWRAHAEHDHALAFVGVVQMRVMEISPWAAPQPFHPRLVVFGTGADF